MVEMVSDLSYLLREQVVMMEVQWLPHSESLRMRVSLESLYGICSELVVRLWITFPKQERERFIFLAYSRVSPVAPVLLTFSEPARSTRHSLDFLTLPCLSVFLWLMKSIVWLREE